MQTMKNDLEGEMDEMRQEYLGLFKTMQATFE